MGDTGCHEMIKTSDAPADHHYMDAETTRVDQGGVSQTVDDRELLRAVVDAALDPLIVTRAVRGDDGVIDDFVIVDCNDKATNYLSRGREEILGRRMVEVFSPDTAEIAMRWAAEAVATRQPRVLSEESLTSIVTSQQRLFDVSVVPVADGAAFTWRDLTDARHALAELRRSQESLRLAMMTAPVAMNIVSVHGSFLQVNPAMCAFLGRTERELRTTKWQTLTHPDDLEKDLALLQDVLDGNRDSYRLLKRFIRPDGQVVWGDMAVAGLRDDNGQVLFLITTIVDLTELVRNRDELAESRERYRILAEHTSDVVLQVSREGLLEWASPSVADTFGWNRDEVIGRPISDFIPQGDWRNVADALASSASDGNATSGQFRVRRRGGRLIWVDATASSVRDPKGHLVRVVRLRDVDARVRARIALQNSEERFRTAMRATPIGVAIINRDGYVVQVNAALSRMLRRSEQSLMGSRITSLTHPEDRSVDLDMWNLLHGGLLGSVTREKRLLDSDGKALWVQNAVASVRDEDGEITSFVAQFLDVSETQQAHAALELMALHDPLTNLKNRRAVLDQLQSVLSHPPRTGWRLGVLYCDLDRFKKVNDVHGHAVGDALLVEVARRMEATVRESDTVGRIGGDEFVVLLTQTRDEESVFAVAQKIREAVSAPFTADGVTLTPTLSIGAALADPGDSPDAVVAKADMALYSAKEQGRDCAVPYSQVLG